MELVHHFGGPINRLKVLLPGFHSFMKLNDLASSNMTCIEGGEGETGRCRHRSKKCCLARPVKGTADLELLTSTVQDLSECGWYYGCLSRKQSTTLLQAAPIGHFIVRDSSDPRFLFSISVQTALGPTSVRIHYSDGRFRLDAEPSLACSVPSFPSVISLVDHYVSLGGPLLCISGSKYSHVLLRKPLYKNCPSLKHLCRLTLNTLLRSSKDVGPLPIPIILKKYLIDYPYTR